MTGAERRRGAIEAAVAIARSLGVGFSNARVLGDSNNTIVHLAPSPVIAKVAILSTESRPSLALERELEVGLHLAARGAPIAPPTASVPPGPHRHRRSLLTLWQLQPNDPHRDVPDAVLADALTEFHHALIDYPGELPPFDAQVEKAGEVLRDPANTPTLPEADRLLLRTAGREVMEELRKMTFASRPLHGEPHRDGNVLASPDGPVFIDFEAACRGPVEWDLTALPPGIANHYGRIDPELVQWLRPARSLCVAVCCWMQPQRAPGVAEAARVHLSLVREQLG